MNYQVRHTHERVNERYSRTTRITAVLYTTLSVHYPGMCTVSVQYAQYCALYSTTVLQ